MNGKDLFDSPDIKDPHHSEWAAKRKISDQTRRMIENLVTCTADELNAIAEVIKDQADRLQAGKHLYGRIAFEQADAEKYGNTGSLGYELNPLDGKSNPIAAPIIVWIDGDQVLGEVNMGWQYEGPSNSVHGGFVAALFDQFLGIGQKLTGQPGFTGTLTVKYLKPTPIGTDLRLVGRVDRIEGRKNFLVGEMWAGDVMTASCEGIFISVTPEMYQALKEGGSVS